MMKIQSAAERMAKGKKLASHRVTAAERIAGCNSQRPHRPAQMVEHTAEDDRMFEQKHMKPAMKDMSVDTYFHRRTPGRTETTAKMGNAVTYSARPK